MSDHTKVEWKPSMTIRTPMVPNFFEVNDKRGSWPIERFDEETLRAVGAAWTERLVAIAASRRAK